MTALLVWADETEQQKTNLYLVPVRTFVDETALHKIADYLSRENCSYISVIADERRNLGLVYVACETRNEAVVASNVLKKDYDADYYIEASFGKHFVETIQMRKASFLSSAAGLVNIIDYYLKPDSEAAEFYNSLDIEVRMEYAWSNIQYLRGLQERRSEAVPERRVKKHVRKK